MADDDLQARVEALERRVVELEDERAVREVIARYGYLADGMRDGEWVELWTDDGVYDLSATMRYPDGASVESAQRQTGTEALRSLITDPTGHRRPGFYGHSMHTGGNTLTVRVDGDEAVAHGYSRVYQDTGGEVGLVSAASNRWTLRKVDGHWRIKERLRRQLGTDGFVENLPAGPA